MSTGDYDRVGGQSNEDGRRDAPLWKAVAKRTLLPIGGAIGAAIGLVVYELITKVGPVITERVLDWIRATGTG